MDPTASAAPTRRTQDQRSARTRTRVLNAAIECLIECGYADTTTTLIAERAGVSRGAQLHHFPTRQELLLEAIVHLAERRGAAARRDAKALTDAPGRLDTVLDLLWQSFQGPLFYASLEIWTAARTDPELHASLVEMERGLSRGIRSLIEDLAGAEIRSPQFDDLIALTLHLLRGMSMQRILRDDDVERRRHFELWKRHAIRILRTPSSP